MERIGRRTVSDRKANCRRRRCLLEKDDIMPAVPNAKASEICSMLDDGFQHRGLFRDVDLVTIDPTNGPRRRKASPHGPLARTEERDQPAHAACVQEKPRVSVPTSAGSRIPIQTIFNGIYKGYEPIDHVRGQPVVAFAGIAKPERFFEALKHAESVMAPAMNFPRSPSLSHRRISQASANRDGNAVFITTEKDAVRLEGIGLGQFPAPAYFC